MRHLYCAFRSAFEIKNNFVFETGSPEKTWSDASDAPVEAAPAQADAAQMLDYSDAAKQASQDVASGAKRLNNVAESNPELQQQKYEALANWLQSNRFVSDNGDIASAFEDWSIIDKMEQYFKPDDLQSASKFRSALSRFIDDSSIPLRAWDRLGKSGSLVSSEVAEAMLALRAKKESEKVKQDNIESIKNVNAQRIADFLDAVMKGQVQGTEAPPNVMDAIYSQTSVDLRHGESFSKEAALNELKAFTSMDNTDMALRVKLIISEVANAGANFDKSIIWANLPASLKAMPLFAELMPSEAKEAQKNDAEKLVTLGKITNSLNAFRDYVNNKIPSSEYDAKTNYFNDFNSLVALVNSPDSSFDYAKQMVVDALHLSQDDAAKMQTVLNAVSSSTNLKELASAVAGIDEIVKPKITPEAAEETGPAASDAASEVAPQGGKKAPSEKSDKPAESLDVNHARRSREWAAAHGNRDMVAAFGRPGTDKDLYVAIKAKQHEIWENQQSNGAAEVIKKSGLTQAKWEDGLAFQATWDAIDAVNAKAAADAAAKAPVETVKVPKLDLPAEGKPLPATKENPTDADINEWITSVEANIKDYPYLKKVDGKQVEAALKEAKQDASPHAVMVETYKNYIEQYKIALNQTLKQAEDYKKDQPKFKDVGRYVQLDNPTDLSFTGTNGLNISLDTKLPRGTTVSIVSENDAHYLVTTEKGEIGLIAKKAEKKALDETKISSTIPTRETPVAAPEAAPVERAYVPGRSPGREVDA